MPLLEPKSLVAFVAGGVVALGAWTMGVASVPGPSAAAPPLAPAVAPSPEVAPREVASPVVASPDIAPRAATIPVVRRACADKRTGALFVIGAGTAKKRCSSGQIRVAWPVPPPPTPPTPSILEPDGSLRLTSPNNQYLLVVNNDGVGIRGPGGAILIDRVSIKEFDSTGRIR